MVLGISSCEQIEDSEIVKNKPKPRPSFECPQDTLYIDTLYVYDTVYIEKEPSSFWTGNYKLVKSNVGFAPAEIQVDSAGTAFNIFAANEAYYVETMNILLMQGWTPTEEAETRVNFFREANMVQYVLEVEGIYQGIYERK